MITRDMFVEDMLIDYPESNQFFLDKGLRCLKCGEAYWGSVEEFLEESKVDEIDENLPADRLIYNVVNTSIGITMTRKIYAFSQQYNSNYFIYDYVFKNTGIVDKDGTVNEQTLEDVVFFFQYRLTF